MLWLNAALHSAYSVSFSWEVNYLGGGVAVAGLNEYKAIQKDNWSFIRGMAELGKLEVQELLL